MVFFEERTITIFGDFLICSNRMWHAFESPVLVSSRLMANLFICLILLLDLVLELSQAICRWGSRWISWLTIDSNNMFCCFSAYTGYLVRLLVSLFFLNVSAHSITFEGKLLWMQNLFWMIIQISSVIVWSLHSYRLFPFPSVIHFLFGLSLEPNVKLCDDFGIQFGTRFGTTMCMPFVKLMYLFM